MKIVKVSPEDLNFPLGKTVWEDPNIWYHGTSSCHSKKIESEGWRAGDLPYSISDVRRVVEIYDTIRVRGTQQDFPCSFDSILYSYTLEGSSGDFEKRSVSLTRDYWRARNYSINAGGETIQALLDACGYFSNLVTNENVKKMHQKRLQDGIDEYNDKERVTGGNLFQKMLKSMNECKKNFEDQEYLTKCEFEIKNIIEKYENVAIDNYPIVYALKLKSPEKVIEVEGTDPYCSRWSCYIESERIKESISQRNIVARVDFPGVKMKYYEVVFGHWISKGLLPWRN